MPEISRTAQEMISGMTPTVRSGEFVFVTVADPALAASLSSEAISFFKEDEGMSLIIPVATARRASLSVDQPMRCITLNVYSSLDGVGLTSAVSTALGDNAIPCNMVAAFHHDHLFVPTKMHDRALQILTALQDQAARDA